MQKNDWLYFVIGAGLCWGTYVPLIAYGGKSLAIPGTPGVANRFASILCVGGAYFLLAIVLPLLRFATTDDKNLQWTNHGIIFASLAGAAGALGAIFVIFATANASLADRIYIAPIIFALAPLVNAIVSLFWHPSKESAFHIAAPKEMPGMLFWIGLVFAAVGTFCILYSKEKSEAANIKPPTPPPVQVENK